MKKTLEPFQIVGRDFMSARRHAINGDDPGLGKTLQAIAAAEMVDARDILVTCPASVRSNWALEISELDDPLQERRWDVISYNQATPLVYELSGRKRHWDLIIMDEVHFCKNVESQRTVSVLGRGGLASRADRRWGLSGTLAPNSRPVELYPILKTLHPAFKDVSFGTYAQKYCGAFWDGRGLNTKGATRIEELSSLLKSLMIRRTKREVFWDRAEPLVSRVPLELDARDLAEVLAAEDEIGGREARISSTYEKFSQMGDTSRLLRLLGMAKVKHVAAFVDDLLESRDKVVVFAQHIDVIDDLKNRFEARGYQPVVYRGGMSDTRKDAIMSRFQLPECRVFIGQRQTAGTGINGLQSVCSTAVIAESPWVPGETEQLIDRLDRMGQNDDLVNAYILYAKGTLDEVVVRVHDRKERVGRSLIPEERVRVSCFDDVVHGGDESWRAL